MRKYHAGFGEKGVCFLNWQHALTPVIDPPQFMNLTHEKRQIILAVVSVCEKYREEIIDEIDEREAKLGREIGKKLASGELSLRELFGRRSDVEELIYSSHSNEISSSKSVKPNEGIAEIAPT
jgi:hypothetical protein